MFALAVATGFWEDLARTLTLRGGHNTTVVLLGTMVLGMASGMIGCFLLLRRRSLVADALSHAALPGVCVAFMIATALGFEGRSLATLLAGAAVFGLIGVGCVQLLTTLPRIREDAAIGVVLSVFFALGVVLLSVIQSMDAGSRAGLQRFIFGQAATMSGADGRLIAIIAGVVLVVCVGMYKELRLLCFDPGFARGLGWSTLTLDGLLLAMLTAITVAGLPSVGAILMVALVIIPPATARFWTERLGSMLPIAAGFGAIGAALGTAASAVLPDVPTGPAIVLACGGLFVISMLLAPRRGLFWTRWRRHRLARSISREHLLRAMYELGEIRGDARSACTVADLLTRRRWSEPRVRRVLGQARRRGEVTGTDPGRWALTDRGIDLAARIVRGHRLWEHFLTTYAGVAPSHVDRGADQIEHVLGRELVAELEASLRQRGVPESVHTLERDDA